ncbi:hypothetical protein DL98DRAFT_539162 [Cadophora sp. DSE1049]|nr:hypothetical protein DL98DRAFT_539162 [Cadophora sp. DSE1049]
MRTVQIFSRQALVMQTTASALWEEILHAQTLLLVEQIALAFSEPLSPLADGPQLLLGRLRLLPRWLQTSGYEMMSSRREDKQIGKPYLGTHKTSAGLQKHMPVLVPVSESIRIPKFTTVLAASTTTKTTKATATATVCPAPFTKCGNTCKNLATDRDNCRTCGTQCPPFNTCEQGVCQPPALQCGTQTKCGATCKDTQTDNNNCGFCGQSCTEGYTCQAGSCERETCHAGGGIQGGFCQGVCVDSQTNNRNCGLCGRDISVVLYLCGDGSRYTCDAGNCVEQPVCVLPDFRIGFVCSGECKDVRNDRDNCGACRNTCPAGDTCVELACTTPPTK